MGYFYLRALLAQATETAVALAEFVYGDENKLITINMTEFQEAHTVSTLKGHLTDMLVLVREGLLLKG